MNYFISSFLVLREGLFDVSFAPFVHQSPPDLGLDDRVLQVHLYQGLAAVVAQPLGHYHLLEDLTDALSPAFDLLFNQDDINDGDTTYFLKGSNCLTSCSMARD